MSDYRYPLREAEFALKALVDFDQLCAKGELEGVGLELAMAIIEEAGKLGSEVLAPLNRVGDTDGAKLTDRGVQESPGFADAYAQFCAGGWASLTSPEAYGGQALPSVLNTTVGEIWQSSNLAFALCPMLAAGATEAIIKHASDELKQKYAPKMVSGEWACTMNLTEPDAGTDLAALKTKAEPNGDHYLISGQKIFITWGDHQMTDNIVHLVLARLPDAPPGVKGISLFIVPKFMVDDNGNLGEANDLRCVSLEHKLGIHGSPTCVMSYGDNGGAVGYLVGEKHNGLSFMFTMMNHARQDVGLQGVAVSERSYQQAVAYAKDRLQGTNKDGSRYTIFKFPDVRRMLMQMKASIEAMRGLALIASAEIDRSHYGNDAEQKAKHGQRVDLLTPIVKGWLTELAQEVTSLGIQIHGGMGFIEETGVAQHYRDARILPIYEGTNGVQALDLVGRKTLLNEGAHLNDLFADIESTISQLAAEPSLKASAGKMQQALEAARAARAWLLDNSPQDKSAPGSVSFSFLMLMGYLCGGWVMAKNQLHAQAQLAEGAGDAEFLKAKLVTANFYFEQLLPKTQAYFAAIESGSESTMALSEEQF
ncbi:acyl-CoA dehydrogenase [Halioxenophilus aromaticivorans]|uniref:3-methylmercaptopropionyl-CoA dehydrogenase n=1 Tax=Halioxenophilus aromaticivorans TaxID=1306992 RepID=A0AAV3TX64_9ALTE